MKLFKLPQGPESSHDNGVQATNAPEPKIPGMRSNEDPYMESRSKGQFTRTDYGTDRTQDVQQPTSASDAAKSGVLKNLDGVPPWVTTITAGGAGTILNALIDKTNGDVLVAGAVTAFIAYLIQRVVIEWLKHRP